jgi:ABC-2 type transport system permease protein
MILLKHELKQNLKSFVIWAGTMNVFIFVFMLMFTLFKDQMAELSEYMASFEQFLAAFGMGGLDLATVEGFFGADASMILLIGGGMYATSLGLNALLNEEKEKTADFLLTKPVSRTNIFFSKYSMAIIYIISFNILSMFITWLSIVVIKEPFPWYTMSLYFLSNFILGTVLMTIAFGLSTFVRNAPVGIAYGVAIAFYVVNTIKNVSDKLDFLKWITPFSINESGTIFSEETLEVGFMIYYGILSLIVLLIGFMYYQKKDIYT